ncbi:response regulator transcription factor [Pyrinomonas methylaliphatogenes]|jgi:two-component system KDP operon response regulator KdpE|uniref:Response regulator with CheY-like receiver domain and winged-helix DNA-binding domain n=1 Tax=Pyrinomonas methylaliphatogenes TaxID=454194 RepID=A0A0B6WW16_9BACT|nr:response regulator transcription factor [Pyrinomonas methylaliphatogenes]MBX5479191.1 response regulator transcription factor [Pyrinomonas methylaliphatogenes]CDM65463.1 response regulator with CheY-like receiver domain and winged-helix DNA-binding domain [Pyrinomonas methylaliphatogenes]
MEERLARILVVDDEPQITRVLRASLTAQGYDVHTALDAASALRIFEDWHPDLIIADLVMPQMSGLEFCRRVRLVSQVPIIVLSVKGDERTKVEALDLGADDYVTKPFGIAELLARIRAALRRARLPFPERTDVLAVGDFQIDLAAREVHVRGQQVRLTPKEFDLLVYFAQNAGRVLTHRKLLGAIWGGEYTEQNEYLRVFVGNLRKKIEPDPNRPRYIVTEPWVGYRFNPQAD